MVVDFILSRGGLNPCPSEIVYCGASEEVVIFLKSATCGISTGCEPVFLFKIASAGRFVRDVHLYLQ
jgi:hypothetical protein